MTTQQRLVLVRIARHITDLMSGADGSTKRDIRASLHARDAGWIDAALHYLRRRGVITGTASGLTLAMEATEAHARINATSDFHTLYRFYDAEGHLLYVGITNDPRTRFDDHRTSKDWWTQVARVTTESHEGRHAAAVAEVTAIRREHPRYNIQHAGPHHAAAVSSTRPRRSAHGTL